MLYSLYVLHHDEKTALRPWTYNSMGFHPLHTFVESAQLSTFGDWHPEFRSWHQPQFNAFVEALWDEAVRLTTKQYGVCQPRTQTDRPPNNTPLMMLAKWGCPSVDDDVLGRMISRLVFEGGGGPALVDNRDTNAVMMAAGAGNKPFFHWFYARAYTFAERGFKWDQRNKPDGRNMLSLAEKEGADKQILKWCEDLLARKFLKKVDFAGGRGGQSSANQRNRGPGNSTKAAYTKVGNPSRGQDWWQYRQPQQSSASSSSWQPQPPSGSASGVGNPAVYAAPPCASPDDIEIVNV